jgi:NTP pyrophosphatase (non-canonical NTP hydrolase)
MSTSSVVVEAERRRRAPKLRVVLCGSYRRDPEGLVAAYAALSDEGCAVVSPLGIEFKLQLDGFVYRQEEIGETPGAIEERHLRALETADFVWLHTPGGYVGVSASMELGFAKAAGVPVYASMQPADVTMASLVRIAASPREAVLALRRGMPEPRVGTLKALQAYYAQAATTRGYSDETAQDCLLLLTEELGELARAVRQGLRLTRDHAFTNNGPAEELADVQLYLVHLANILSIDLDLAVQNKERENWRRYDASETERSAS